MKKMNSIIFDFNGTLLWDTPLHNIAWNIFLERHNLPFRDIESNPKVHGLTNSDILQFLFNRKMQLDEIKTLAEEKESIYREIVVEKKLWLAEGVEDFFDYCKELNLKIGIATASEKANVDFFISHFNLQKWFDRKNIIFNDHTFKCKPAPDIYFKTAKTMNIKAEETIIFEDSQSGIKAAQSFGAKKIIIVDSNNDNYSNFNYPIIKKFDRNLIFD